MFPSNPEDEGDSASYRSCFLRNPPPSELLAKENLLALSVTLKISFVDSSLRQSSFLRTLQLLTTHQNVRRTHSWWEMGQYVKDVQNGILLILTHFAL